LLEKEVSTKTGVPAKYWKVNQYIGDLKRATLDIEILGFATKDAEEPITRYIVRVEDVTPLIAGTLEDFVTRAEQWQNLK
jgi:hypothetical protein